MQKTVAFLILLWGWNIIGYAQTIYEGKYTCLGFSIDIPKTWDAYGIYENDMTGLYAISDLEEDGIIYLQKTIVGYANLISDEDIVIEKPFERNKTLEKKWDAYRSYYRSGVFKRKDGQEYCMQEYTLYLYKNSGVAFKVICLFKKDQRDKYDDLIKKAVDSVHKL
ncbi:MAG: hypothetical protein KF690_09705 [Bacteroidetes bacterium]|nr:hypothetical protein [Bacteroidota bacterium]